MTQQAHIVIISGAPGTGKSSIASLLAEQSAFDRAVHIHTDDFYRYIRKGYIEPWKPESNNQNIIVADVMVSCAEHYARGGYEAIIDGVVGPWHLAPWIRAAQNGIAVHYIVLRPDLQTAISRATTRTSAGDLTDAGVVTAMWEQFADLGEYETHAIDTANQSIGESAAAIRGLLHGGRLRIE